MAPISQPVKMKAVIFAGGVGSRMWPLSRQATPKQFEKIIDNKSTLQLTLERLAPEFDPQDIYISTGTRYLDIIHKQAPQIPSENLLGEPVMNDVAPAVGYSMAVLAKKFPHTPTAILWSDHLLKNVTQFKHALFCGADYLSKHPNKIVFLGQKPRFASQNLGWIEFGQEIGHINSLTLRQFVSWHYRPDLKTATKYLNSGHHAWNPGYFIVTPQFILDQFRAQVPDMHQGLLRLQRSFGTRSHPKLLRDIYPTFPKISFDDLIVTNIPAQKAVVISVDLGWSDLGAWEALKEALQTSPEQNVTHGQVRTKNTTDSLIYSYTDQLVTTVDMQGVVVVVTPDVILVTPKDSIPEVKKLVTELKESGLEHLT